MTTTRMERPAATEKFPWTVASLVAYLEGIGYSGVRILRQAPLGKTGPEEAKGFGYGRPVLVEFETGGHPERLVLHTVSANSFGHDRSSDRAESLLLAHATFNRLPRHVRSVDVGVLSAQGDLLSLGRAGEFFLLTRYAPGEIYARDLERIREAGALAEGDEERARALALYLADIHRMKRRDPAGYHRRIRDLLGHGEGIFGLTDSYPEDFSFPVPDFLERVEHEAVRWRWRLRKEVHRLSQVHGDFHPFNILFRSKTDFHLLDRSRGEWGEPADDVTALSINYLFFALQKSGRFEGPLRRLFDLFWKTYVEASGDPGVLDAAPPFFAWRGLVVASPIWYPAIAAEVRRVLFGFVERVLESPRFDPESVDALLRSGP
jgi:hypothetical protein